MIELTDEERIGVLKEAASLIFQVEDSYPMRGEDKGDIRHDGYRVRLAIADIINRIRWEKAQVPPC